MVDAKIFIDFFTVFFTHFVFSLYFKVDAKMVNKGFIIAFPITFIIFIGYMVIQVILCIVIGIHIHNSNFQLYF